MSIIHRLMDDHHFFMVAHIRKRRRIRRCATVAVALVGGGSPVIQQVRLSKRNGKSQYLFGGKT